MIYCLIPAKPHDEAKSRLAPVLGETQRAELNRRLFRRTLRLALAVVGCVVVVSRDPALLRHAETEGAWALPEATPGLNPALTQAARFAQDQGASRLLVLPTDLPRLVAADLETMLALSSVARVGNPFPRAALVIAPCRRGTGTNVLLLRPPDIIPFAFGPRSFAAHCAAAHNAGVEPIVYRSDRVAFDLDTPEDWELGFGEAR